MRCVGVIWFVLMFANFYQLNLYNKICVALANLWWSIGKTWIENRTSLVLYWLLRVHICWLLDLIHRSSWIAFGVINDIWRRNPISVHTCVFMVFALWSLANHVPIKSRGPIKKKNQVTTGVPWSVKILVTPSPTGYMLWSFSFSSLI